MTQTCAQQRVRQSATTGHVPTHAVAPELRFGTEPEGQCWQASAGPDEYVPLPQREQPVRAALANWPAAQSEQLVEPFVAVYEPVAEQERQLACLVLGWYLPGTHCVHDADVCVLAYCPAAQSYNIPQKQQQ